MITGLKPYPAMKDSGVSWLGNMPAHWETLRLKTAFREIDHRSGTGAEPLLSLRMQQGLVDHHAMGGTAVAASDLVNYKRTQPGEIVMNRMRAAAGLFAATPFLGLVSPDYAVLRPRIPVDLQYFVLVFRTPQMMSVFRAESRGLGTGESGFLRLYTERFGMLAAPVPPLGEQAGIVRFLDYVDRRIRRYIRAKQKLIKLLEEQKQAIIHRAVTRGLPAEAAAKAGLDRNVRLKPSGVEWLGDVSEHWEIRRLKSLVVRIDQGVSPQAENYLADRASWGVLKAGCVNRGVSREEEHKRLPAGFRIDANLAIAEGDVLVSRASGSPQLVGSVGRVCSLRYRLILSDKTFRLLFQESVEPDFMVLVMNSRYYREQVEQAISGAEGLANNLPLSSLRGFRFAIPKHLAEQHAIVRETRGMTSPLVDAVMKAGREIALLREYRTRLIADVVTGKLDVREAAARLPDEVEEPEPLDDTAELTELDADAEGDGGDSEPEELEA